MGNQADDPRSRFALAVEQTMAALAAGFTDLRADLDALRASIPSAGSPAGSS
jgi:hypothetical protein